jgi:calcium-binding protein CML
MIASAEFRRVFASFDQDGDGKISEAELRLCMKAALGVGGDMSAKEVQALMATADIDGDGFLDEEESLVENGPLA